MMWITKHLKKILSEKIAHRARTLGCGICERHQAEIFRGHTARDHIHLFVPIPQNLAPGKLAQQLKGKRYLMPCSINFWSYAANTKIVISGAWLFFRGGDNVTDEVVRRYRAAERNGWDISVWRWITLTCLSGNRHGLSRWSVQYYQ